MPGSIRCRSMRFRHFGHGGRSISNSCGNALPRMEALRISYVCNTNISKAKLASVRYPTRWLVVRIATNSLGPCSALHREMGALGSVTSREELITAGSSQSFRGHAQLPPVPEPTRNIADIKTCGNSSGSLPRECHLEGFSY